ncbi:LysR family transcriptional regulator [Acidimangrovimonas pyrenivorans]|uniref:LysR family transcriptional regulator n=1 Tax=Acidimangrovimonas pyrenivorans TaxID=2030798 RepID=A0ABV7AH62_9RHOB
MTPWLSLPPLSALRAFAAYVETGSVSAAGARLNVSHAAVSQQLRALETHLGVRLLDRSGRALELTTEGRLLADAVTAGFGGIARVVELLTGAEQSRPLQVTTTPSFAGGWLMPRLADFRSRHPEIDLAIDPSGAVKPLGPGGHDVALRYGNGDWAGTEAHLLVDSGLVVIAAPELVGGRAVGCVADLADLPWMQELGTNEATDFLERHGVARGAGGLTSLPGNMMIDAVRDGQGVAVIARAFVAADIAAGRLRLLFEDDSRKGYFLVTPQGVMRPAVKAFAQWALRQAAQDRRPT